ncbi:MAG: class I SAM-dependent methyltransferase [Pseudonocardia sp.]
MRVVDAGSLTRSNLVYREPALYDELLADDSLASDLLAVVERHHASARTVLDLGCGTGRLLAQLRGHGFDCTGIDLQPNLIAWAQDAHPGLRLMVDDLCSTRLGTHVDVVTCVGNTLSYLHTDAELSAAFDTVRAHSHPGTLLALATLTDTGSDTRSSSEITTSLGAATVITTTESDPTTDIQTTTRTWRFTNGRVEHDTMHRRIWRSDVLAALTRAVGFEIVSVALRSSLTLCSVHR